MSKENNASAIKDLKAEVFDIIRKQEVLSQQSNELQKEKVQRVAKLLKLEKE